MKKKEKRIIFDIQIAKSKIDNSSRGRWWRRVGSKGKGFKYFDVNKNIIADEENLQRIKLLVIPPIWKHVRISPAKSSKLQAVGIDSSGRIQYIYHQDFSKKQQLKKFSKIERFGIHLPKLRSLTNEHLLLESFPKEKVLAIMVRLVNSLYIRMGTEQSVRNYKTYGITTLQNRHLEFGKNNQLIFKFVGKHHIKHRKVLVDEELAKVMRNLKNLGTAKKLFHYLDDDQKAHQVKSFDLNNYLKSLTSAEFSLKDFRTWGGTLLTAIELALIGKPNDEKEFKKNLCKAIKKVAVELGNTPTVCRSSYVHPKVLESYHKGITIDNFRTKNIRRISHTQNDHEVEEKALLKLFMEK
jgi:DNA topoisomerase-1